MESEKVADTTEDKDIDEFKATGELDLSEIESMLDEMKVDPEAEDQGEDPEDIDLALDTESKETEEIEDIDENDEVDELDLSEIESMLDEVGAEFEAEDFEFDMEPEEVGETEQIESDGKKEEIDEFDLSEIKNVFNETETEPEGEDQEEELKDLELDLESEPVEPPIEEYTSESENFELEFESDDNQHDFYEDEVTPDQITEEEEPIESADNGSRQAGDGVEETVIIDNLDKNEEEEMTGVKPVVKKRISMPLFILLIIVLVGAASFVTCTLLGIRIPFISDLPVTTEERAEVQKVDETQEKQQIEDAAGRLRINPLEDTIDYKFVENSKAGTLFVITGQVRNEYDHPRSYITILSRLYTKGDVVAATETSYCGNMLSDIELETLNLNAIKKRIKNRSGDNESNVKLKSGATIPFMVVISDLPEDMEMYRIEVAGSLP